MRSAIRINTSATFASIIHHRLAHATARPAGSRRTRRPARLIAGLIPRVDGPVAEDMRQALDERRDLVEARADAVLDAARRDGESWKQPLGTSPMEARGRQRWRQHARVIAAYRDRYAITDGSPLGQVPQATAQKIDRARADAALRALTGPQRRDQQRPAQRLARELEL